MLAALALAQPGTGQAPGEGRPPPALKFDRVTRADGLPTAPTEPYAQDAQGVLWVVSWHGLYRYDGHGFQGYWHDPESPESISDDWTTSVEIDRDGTYWVGTHGGGLNRFDPARGAFSPLRHDPRDPTSLSNDEVIAVHEDRGGALWVGTGYGLNRKVPGAGAFTRFMGGHGTGLLGNQIRAIHEDRDGVLWVGTGNPFVPGQPGGLHRYDPARDAFTAFQVAPEDTLSPRNHVLAITSTADGALWIGTWGGGLHRFDPSTEAFAAVTLAGAGGQALNVTSIAEQPGSEVLWVGTYGAGLYRYDRGSGASARYGPEERAPHSLSDPRVWRVFFDRSGQLWVGTHSGLSKTDPVGLVPRFRPGAAGLAFGEDEWVTSLHDGEAERLWIGTTAGRLLSWNRAADRWRAFSPPRERCLGWDLTGVSVAAARAGGLWVATRCGLFRFDPRTAAFDPYRPPTPLPADLGADHALRMAEDRDGRLWLSTEPLLRVDPAAGAHAVFRHDPDDPTSISSDDVDALLLGTDGTLWVGAAPGLNRFDPATGTFTRMLTAWDAQPAAITGIHEDDEGDLWLASDVAGLVHLDPETGEARRFTVRDGLHTNTLFDLAEDASGTFWLFSPRGVSAFDPRTRVAKTFEPEADGFVTMTFGRRAVLASGGALILGGRGGLNAFDPARYRPDAAAPPVTLTALDVGDVPLLPGPGSPLDRPLHEAERLTLAHTQNDLTLHYAAVDLRTPHLTRYRYRLDGYDTDWVEADGQRSARYTNLSPGRYAFRVTAATGAGPWNAEHPTLHLTIRPPWWRTPWAYALFGLLGLGALYGVRRYEMNRLRLKHDAELEHAEAEALRALDRAKSRFFTNISHEFRTPLTLILGPVTDALERGDALPRSELPVVRRNGERLLRLVNQLLDLARLEANEMALQTERADLVLFLKGVLYSFESLAEQERIALHFEAEPDRIPVAFERGRLEQAFYNLIANAFKFTAPGGTISVACTATGTGLAEVEVRDTGSGIPPEDLPRVFDRFFQTTRSEARPHAGSGIGLALTKAMVELHGGTIAVESEAGAGTVFTVRLPLAAEAPLPAGDGVPEGRAQTAAWPDEPAAGPAPAEDPDAPGPVADAVVLIVEDNADVRAYVRRHLDEAYRILEAADGAEGLALARETIPDLIVTDVMMPEVDGYALARAVRADERTSHVPIVMLTAKAAEGDRIEGLETGVDDYLLKPFSPRELRARVRNLIAQRRLLRERFSTATVIRPSEVSAVSLDQAFLGRVGGIVEEHLEDEAFSVADLAGEAGFSVSQLNRKLNALVGQSAGQLVRSMRLQRGADLLAQRAGTVAEIAYRVGFSSQAHFSTSFKKQFGVTPTAYREAHSGAAEAGGAAAPGGAA